MVIEYPLLDGSEELIFVLRMVILLVVSVADPQSSHTQKAFLGCFHGSVSIANPQSVDFLAHSRV